MAEYPQRTYVENPDAYLSEFTIEDHVRDIDYGTQKLKNFIESFYKDYPGFVTYPTVTKNITNNTTINVGPFIGIDGNRNAIVFGGLGNLTPSDFQLDTKYYLVCRIVLTTTDDQATNPKQKNKKYYKILQEIPDIVFTSVEPYKELVLGTVIFSQDNEGTIVPTISYDERSALLPNMYSITESFTILQNAIDNTYLKKTRIQDSGDLVYNLTDEEFGQYIYKAGHALGVNSDASIDERFLNKVRLRERLVEEITLLANGSETAILIPSKFKSLKITNNASNIYGEFLFKNNGNIEEIEISDVVYTTENPEFGLDPDTIFISSSILSGQVQVVFKNNFTTDMTIQYFVR